MREREQMHTQMLATLQELQTYLKDVNQQNAHEGINHPDVQARLYNVKLHELKQVTINFYFVYMLTLTEKACIKFHPDLLL